MTGFFARSHAAWYTLVLVTLGTGGGIYAIHRSQTTERENLHKGVLRDQELYLLKKAQHKLLKEKQVVRRSSDPG